MANITRFDPLNELMDDFFKGFFVRPMVYEGEARGTALRMKVDVSESSGAYVVTAELPGIQKEDVQISIDGAQVTLNAEIKREREVSEHERVLHAERVFGKLTRSFTLPQEVDERTAQAKLLDGVLELTLPKKAAASRRTITVQ